MSSFNPPIAHDAPAPPGAFDNYFVPIHEYRPSILFDIAFASLPPGTNENMLRGYALGWMWALTPDPDSIVTLLGVANELKAHPRPLDPCTLLALSIPKPALSDWAFVLLNAIRSHGFETLSFGDKTTLVQMHAAAAARQQGATLDPARAARRARRGVRA